MWRHANCELALDITALKKAQRRGLSLAALLELTDVTINGDREDDKSSIALKVQFKKQIDLTVAPRPGENVC